MTRTTHGARCAAAALFVLGSLGAPRAVVAQQPPRTPASLSQPLQPAERALLVNRVAADPRMRQLVGEQPTRTIVGEPIFEKADLERYLTQESAPPPVRRFSVVEFDAKTNRAARAYATADGNVLQVEAIPPTDVPFTGEDVRDALTLVRGSAAARRAIPTIDQFQPQTPGVRAPREAYVAQMLPLRSTDPKDPCTRDRCADLIFRTPRGYLSVRAHVDFTRRSVEVEGPRR